MSPIIAACNGLWRRYSASDPFESSPLRKAPYLAVALFIALAHVGSSWFGYLLLSGGAQVTPVFPEAGLDLVIVLVFGSRYWPILLASYFASSLWRHVPWLPSCGVAFAGLIRTYAAAFVIRWISGFRKTLGHFEDVAAITLAAAASPALASGFGTICLVLGGRFPAAQWPTVLSRWWISDALGMLTVAPVLLAAARGASRSRSKHGPWFPIHCLLYLGVLSVACYLVFFRNTGPELLFSVFALILLSAAALGPTAARIAAFLIASAAIWATHSGIGSFTGGTVREDLQNLDLFLAAVALTGMAVGAFRLTGNLVLPGGVLLAGWALSGWLYASMDHDRVNYNQARLDSVISSIERHLADRYTAYEDALWSAAGQMAASQRINRRDWSIYVSHSGLLERHPGTTHFSVVEPVPDSALARFTEDLRRRDWPEFSVRPMNPALPPPPEHFLVVCAEPASVSQRALGADLATDDRRREAAEQARDSGRATMTRNLEMRDGSGKGLQLFVPVYREGAPIDTVAERRRALMAWVSVGFSADVFIRAALDDLQSTVSLRAYDDGPGAAGSLFFASGPPPAGGRPFERTTDVALGGRTWVLGWERLAGFPSVSNTPSAWAAGCTALLSLFLAGLVLALQTTSRRAADRLKMIQSALALGTWEIHLDSRKVRCSGQLLTLYGIHNHSDQLDLEEWLTRVHPDERERRITQAGATVEDRAPIERQYRAVWPDGSVHWLHSKAIVVFDKRGNAVRMVGVDFDITQDKRNEERVRILYNAVDQSPVSIVIADLRGRIEYCNPRLTESTGYTLEELKGRDSRVLVSQDTPAGQLDEIVEALKTGSWKGILKIARKDGTSLAAATHMLWIRDAAGAPTHRLSVAVDITERLEMEAALKLSEERFRIAAESSGDSIYEWDLRTDEVAVLGGNRVQPLVEGWALPRGKDFRAMLHPADREPIEKAIRRHLDLGEPYSQEYRVLTPNGEIRYYLDTASALRDEQGPYKWIGVCKDITEQKKVERANAELAKIVECADAAMISKDLEGRVLTWNRGAERIYGYSAGEMTGKDISLLLPADRVDEEHRIMEKLRRGHATEHFETIRVTKSGKPINVLLTLSPIRDHRGSILGGAHVAWDITQLKQLQAQLAQAQKLESIGHLAAGVAHEINTPIQYIGDNGKFLEEAFHDLIKWLDSPQTEDGGLEYLRREIPNAVTQLLEGVQNVAGIVRAMKEFSHPGPVEKMPFDVNRAIESTIMVSRNEWKYVTEVTTDLDPDLPPVPCIAGEFNQVILNLIVNSAHAIASVVGNSGRKGAIHIITRRKGALVEIRVTDTGCGIPAEIQSKVFDPFFTTKPVGQGTGQGLAIAHSVIVQKHGGTLRVESEPGLGATFIIELPLERELVGA